MRQLADPVQHIPHWRTHDYFWKAEAIAAELLGEAVRYHEDQILMKPPRYPAETPWHQDSAYWQGEGVGYERAITCWLALSPAHKSNGGLQFIPASHLDGAHSHHDALECTEIADARETPADVQRAVAPALAPGDATFHHTRARCTTAGETIRMRRAEASSRTTGRFPNSERRRDVIASNEIRDIAAKP